MSATSRHLRRKRRRRNSPRRTSNARAGSASQNLVSSRATSRARARTTAPPAGYTPIILPGESISKYRNLPQPAAEPQAAVAAATGSDDGRREFPAEHAETAAGVRRRNRGRIAIHLDSGIRDGRSPRRRRKLRCRSRAAEAASVAEAASQSPKRSRCGCKQEEKPRQVALVQHRGAEAAAATREAASR